MTAKATIAGAISESDLQAAVIELARLKSWMVHHDRGDYRNCIAGDKGFPDLVISQQGVTYFLEVKTETGKLTKAQEAWRAALGGSGTEDEDWDDLLYGGGCYAVIRPSRWQDGTIARFLE